MTLDAGHTSEVPDETGSGSGGRSHFSLSQLSAVAQDGGASYQERDF